MYPDDTFLRHLFFAKKKEYKRFVKKQKRQFHSALLDKIDALADKNPKEYWKLVNSIKANQTKKVSNEILCSEWFEYFKNLNKGASLYTEESSTEAQIVKDFNLWASGKMTPLMSQFQLMKYIEFPKNGKACGSDPLSNEIIKLLVTVLPSYFVKLFNAILSKGVFPASCSKVFIVPIYKTGSTGDPNNYRVFVSAAV